MARKTLLLVEDNPDDEELILRAIRQIGADLQVLVAHDGVEALELLRGTGRHGAEPVPWPPRAVWLDLRMPRMDGWETLERIRADPDNRLIPVVVFTTSNERRDIVRSYALGASSYVRKPVQFDALREAVARMIEYWFHVNEPPPSVEPEKVLMSAGHRDRSSARAPPPSG